MIETPEVNIKLTSEETQRIETAKIRINNTEAEIKIAESNLSVIQKDILKSIKDQKYQSANLDAIEKNISDKKSEHEQIVKNIDIETKNLDKIRSEGKSIVEKNENISEDLKLREENLKKSEKTHEQKVIEHLEKEKEINNKKLAVDNAASVLKDAIKNITW